MPVCHGLENPQKCFCVVGGVADTPPSTLCFSTMCCSFGGSFYSQSHFRFSLCWNCDKPICASCQMWVWMCVWYFYGFLVFDPVASCGTWEEEIGSSISWVLVETWLPAETLEQPLFLCTGSDMMWAPEPNRDSRSLNQVCSRAALVNQIHCPFTSLYAEIDFEGWTLTGENMPDFMVKTKGLVWWGFFLFVFYACALESRVEIFPDETRTATLLCMSHLVSYLGTRGRVSAWSRWRLPAGMLQCWRELGSQGSGACEQLQGPAPH